MLIVNAQITAVNAGYVVPRALTASASPSASPLATPSATPSAPTCPLTNPGPSGWLSLGCYT
jgi:hypothetical protein